jgi:hypothetical protein
LNDVALEKLLSPYFHLVRKDFIKNFEPTLDSKRSAAYGSHFISIKSIKSMFVYDCCALVAKYRLHELETK